MGIVGTQEVPVTSAVCYINPWVSGCIGLWILAKNSSLQLMGHSSIIKSTVPDSAKKLIHKTICSAVWAHPLPPTFCQPQVLRGSILDGTAVTGHISYQQELGPPWWLLKCGPAAERKRECSFYLKRTPLFLTPAYLVVSFTQIRYSSSGSSIVLLRSASFLPYLLGPAPPYSLVMSPALTVTHFLS